MCSEVLDEIYCRFMENMWPVLSDQERAELGRYLWNTRCSSPEELVSHGYERREHGGAGGDGWGDELEVPHF